MGAVRDIFLIILHYEFNKIEFSGSGPACCAYDKCIYIALLCTAYDQPYYNTCSNSVATCTLLTFLLSDRTVFLSLVVVIPLFVTHNKNNIILCHK